jgi:nucleoside-diphosphate-sugar epimerase
MRYFITGATGFLGGRIARQLIEAGHEVVTIARNPASAGDLAALGVAVHQGDITDRESLREPMRGADGLYHIAAWYQYGARDKSPAEAINVGGTRNVLEVMRELGIPRGVYTSTINIFSDTHGQVVDESYRHDGPHLTEYDRTKWLAHYEVAVPMARAGLPLVIVQPGLIYGPGDKSVVRELLVQYLGRRLLLVPRDATYCWGYVDDIAAGHLLAMERGTPGESYILTGPRHTLVEMLGMAERMTGIPVPRLRAPGGVLRAVASLADLAGRVISLPPAYSGEALRASAGVTYLASSEKARRELGFSPRPLQEGLREMLVAEMERLGMAPVVSPPPAGP